MCVRACLDVLDCGWRKLVRRPQWTSRNRSSRLGSLPTAAVRAALSAALACAPRVAMAACNSTFPVTTFDIASPSAVPAQNYFPLGTGSSINALISTFNTVNTSFLAGSSAYVHAPADSRPSQPGGGMWTRFITGNIDTSAVTTSTIGSPDDGTGTCKGSVLLVTELSRWGRSTQDLVQTLDDLHGWKVSVLAQTGLSFDLSTASGKLMRTIMAGLAEFERDLIRDRIKSGMARAKAAIETNGHFVTKDGKTRKSIGRQAGERPSDKKVGKVLELHKEGLSYRKNTVMGIVQREVRA
jgi:putative DNA-invertase from lambdoid prophage Rac